MHIYWSGFYELKLKTKLWYKKKNLLPTVISIEAGVSNLTNPIMLSSTISESLNDEFISFILVINSFLLNHVKQNSYVPGSEKKDTLILVVPWLDCTLVWV